MSVLIINRGAAYFVANVLHKLPKTYHLKVSGLDLLLQIITGSSGKSGILKQAGLKLGLPCCLGGIDQAGVSQCIGVLACDHDIAHHDGIGRIVGRGFNRCCPVDVCPEDIIGGEQNNVVIDFYALPPGPEPDVGSHPVSCGIFNGNVVLPCGSPVLNVANVIEGKKQGIPYPTVCDLYLSRGWSDHTKGQRRHYCKYKNSFSHPFPP